MANEWNIMKPPIHQFQNQQLSPYHRFCSSRYRPSVQWSVAAPSSPAPVYGYGSKPGAPLLTAVEKSLDTTGKDVHRCSSPQSTQYQSISYIYINIIYLDRPQLRTKQLSAPSQIGSLPYSGDFFSSPVLGLATAQCSIAMVTITKTTFFNGNEPIKSEQYSITHGYKMIHILIESCWFIYIDNISEATFTSQNLTGW